MQRRVLVTRDSARQLGLALERLSPAAEDDSITLDFEGIEAMTPSFVDELLGVIDHVIANPGRQPHRLVLSHAPTRLSEKFIAIARARNVNIAEVGEDSWSITQLSA